MTIDNIWFIIAIGIVTIITAFKSDKGKFTDTRYKWYHRFTKRGYEFIFVSILLVILLALQEFNSRKLIARGESNLRNQEESRDVEITKRVKKGIDSATTKLYDGLSEALSKQGIKYDSLRKDFQRVRDSAKVTIITGENPLLGLYSLTIIDSTTNKGFIKFKYEISSEDASSYDLDLKLDVIGKTIISKKYFMVERDLRLLSRGEIIPKGKKISSSIWIRNFKGITDRYCFNLKGSYRKSDKTLFKIDKFYVFFPVKIEEGNNKDWKSFGTPLETELEELKKYTGK